jgi:hypothetical protein
VIIAIGRGPPHLLYNGIQRGVTVSRGFFGHRIQQRVPGSMWSCGGGPNM